MKTSSAKKAPPPPSERGGARSNIGLWLIGASVAIAGVVVATILFNENSIKSAPVAQPNVAADWIDRTVVGSPEAKVVVQLWEDFLCPTCQDFSTTIKPVLMQEYVEPGMVRLEFRYFPLSQHDPGATMAALASECAADQEMFWPYSDRVFQMTKVDQQEAVQFDDLVQYAGDIGMDTQKFSSCQGSQQHRATINASLAQAQRLQLHGTPSIFVNGTLLGGSSLAEVKAAIDEQLAPATQLED